MNQKYTTSPNTTLLTEDPEFPERPERRHGNEPEAAPKWKNLTLDELESWLEEHDRRPGTAQ